MCECQDIYRTNFIDHCPPGCRTDVLQKVYELLNEKMSYTMHKRHVILLRKYLKLSNQGFHLVDLPTLIPIFEILSNRLHLTPCYKPLYKEMLELCHLPLLVYNKIDETNGLKHINYFLSMIGSIAVWILPKELRQVIFESLLSLIKDYEAGNTNTVQLKNFYGSIEESFLPEIATQLLNFVENEEYSIALELCTELSKISQKIAYRIALANGIEYVLIHLEVEEDLCNVLEQTRLLLWNILESLCELSEERVKKVVMPSQRAFTILHAIFRIEILERGREFQRNDLMGLILLFLEAFPHVPFVDSGMAKDLLSLLATDTTETWCTDFKLLNSEQDFTFMRMLLACLCYFNKYIAIDQFILDLNVVKTLINILIFNDKTWLPDQQKILSQYILHVFNTFDDHFAEYFVKHNGPESLLMILEEYILEPNYPDLLKLCFQTINKLVMKNEKLISYFGEIGIPVFIKFANFVNNSELTIKNQEFLSYAFDIANRLLQENGEQSQLLFDALHAYLMTVSRPLNNCIDPRTVICALDLLWKILWKNYLDFDIFLRRGIVYILLDIIDVSSFPVKVIALGMLVDLCENELSVPFVITWCGGTDRNTTIYAMLAQIYREENKKLAVMCDDMQIITDAQFPLMGQLQFEQLFSPKRNMKSCPSILEMYGSSRPKIHALIQLLNVRHANIIANQKKAFDLYSPPLNTLDQITMVLIENFFVMKICEVWQEVDVDLKRIEIQLTQIDRQVLEVILKKALQWSQSIKNKQRRILRQELVTESRDELVFYKLLKTSTKQDALFALQELKYMARCADKMFMQQYKNKHRKEIMESLTFDDSCIQNLTYTDNIDVTPVFEMRYNIKYNRKQSKN